MSRTTLALLTLGCVVTLSLAACEQKARQSEVESTLVPASPAGPVASGSSAPMSGPAAGRPQDYDEAQKTPSNAPMGGSSPRAATPQRPPIQLAGFQESQPDRYLIKNASLTLEVKDARDASQKLAATIQVSRGYLADMQESVDALGAGSITMTVRVPARRFDGAMTDIESLGKVLDRHVGAEDVTEEFVDSQSRLRNLKRTEDRLLAHLVRTGRLSDTLLVEKELTRVRQAIEQLEGRLRFLTHRIAYSSIEVTLREAAKAQPLTPPISYSSAQVASEATRTLVGFGQSVWSILIWLAIWSPVWVLTAVLAWLIYRRTRRVESKPATA